MTFRVPEHLRILGERAWGANGHFLLPAGATGRELFCVASDGGGWEHVSVSAHGRQLKKPPNWDEMARVKDTFWGEDDVVLQYHPAKKDYVNNMPGVLHLWRPIGVELPAPLSILVGKQGEDWEATKRRVETGDVPPEVSDEEVAKAWLEKSDRALDRFRAKKG